MRFVQRVVFFFLTAQIGRGKGRVGPFRRIANTPIKTVDEQVNVAIVPSQTAHRAHRVFHPRITRALAARALVAVPVHPRKIEIDAQVYRIEFIAR